MWTFLFRTVYAWACLALSASRLIFRASMAYAAAILTMRGEDELLVVIWGGVYCPVDFLLLLETDHFIPELCPFLVLPPTLLLLLVFPNAALYCLHLFRCLSVYLLLRWIWLPWQHLQVGFPFRKLGIFKYQIIPLTEMSCDPSAFFFLRSA